MADVKDMAAVGNVARGKKDSGGPLTLKSITVDLSDNGGATVREIRERKVPEGRRAGAGFPLGSDVKENTFENMDRVRAHVMSLLGGGAAPGAGARPTLPPPPPRPAGPIAPVAAPMRPQPMPPPGGGGGGPF